MGMKVNFSTGQNNACHEAESIRVTKKFYNMFMLMACLLIACYVCSCSKDNDDTTDSGSDLNIVIDSNGNANGGHSFTRIDDKNFYIDDIKYTVVDNVLEVTGYDETFFKGEAKIISSLYYHETLLNVKSIGKNAFSSCEALATLSIPQSVTSIKESAFRNCKQLKSISIKGEGLNTIDDSAFSGCVSITSFTIPNSVVSVGSLSFGGCSGLASVIIGKNVTSISKDSFRGCTNLTSIKVESGNTEFDSRDNCNALITTENNTLFLGCKNTTIPDNVTSIGYNSFYGCSGLSSITIPSNVTSIGQYAFKECKGLLAVNMSDKITTIDMGVFEDCTSLASITIPNNVTTIENSAFSGCTSLNSVIIGSSVESISRSAFSGCSKLATVTIFSNSIISKANYYNTVSEFFGDQVDNYIIGEGVTSIGEWAFYKTTKMSSVIIPSSVTTIGKGAFAWCYGLTSVVIPSSVTSIEYGTFDRCTSLSSVTIPNSVTSIGEWSFRETRLESLTIPNSVTSIGSSAFYDCYNLHSVIIGNAVTYIGSSAFSGCSRLTDVYCYVENMSSSSYGGPSSYFYNTNISNGTLHVPSVSIEVYKAANPWKEFKNIVALTASDPRP